MPLIQTDSQHYSDIADAIRDMSGNEETFYPSEMAAGVRSIPQTIAIQPIIYSLEEREVGVWTDGKPLYQKSYFIPSLPSSAGEQKIPLNITGIEVKRSFGDAYWQTGSSREITALGMTSNAFDGSMQVVMSIENNESIRIYVGTNRSTLSALVTIQYTKTTDTPGSGTWTPSGVPAHHYSTEEQVIGTWIDGKPLYEKSYVLSSASTGGITLEANVSTLNICKIEGVYTDDATRQLPTYSSPSTPVVVYKYQNAIQIQNSSGRTLTDIRVTIQYTKTTD